MKIGAGVAGMALLGQQLKNYEAQLVQMSENLTEIINGLQREANREFHSSGRSQSDDCLRLVSASTRK
jgi:hypothetical protein